MNMCIHPAVVRRLAALAVASFFAIPVPILLAAEPTSATIKFEHFEHDPGWEGYHNHNVPTESRMVQQDFGYSKTRFASKAPGELGGRIQRTSTPASYAAPVSPVRTLEDKLTASGTFTLAAGKGTGGAFFGFFNSQQPGGS